jgi:uncharacterized protein YndB with AHSA1/START domain
MTNAETLTITTPTDTEIVVTRIFNAPRTLVFEAWTNPKFIAQWMLGPGDWTMPVCEIDLRPGGAWHFVWRRANGTQMEMRGVYREVAPPDRLVSTESWGGDWPETVNTLTLSEEHGKTTAVLTITYPSKDAREAATQTGMKDGMAKSYERLEQFLASVGSK